MSLGAMLGGYLGTKEQIEDPPGLSSSPAKSITCACFGLLMGAWSGALLGLCSPIALPAYCMACRRARLDNARLAAFDEAVKAEEQRMKAVILTASN